MGAHPGNSCGRSEPGDRWNENTFACLIGEGTYCGPSPGIAVGEIEGE